MSITVQNEIVQGFYSEIVNYVPLFDKRRHEIEVILSAS